MSITYPQIRILTLSEILARNVVSGQILFTFLSGPLTTMTFSSWIYRSAKKTRFRNITIKSNPELR